MGSSPTPMPISPPIGEEVDRIRIPDDDSAVVIPHVDPGFDIGWHDSTFFPDDPGWVPEPGMLPPDDIDWESKWGSLPIEEPEGWYPDDPFHFG